MTGKNYRNMSDEELESWRKEVIEKKEQRDPREEHRKALRAMQSPIRREIMTILKEKALTIDELAANLKLDEQTLIYHLRFLKDIFFITIKDKMVDLTPSGVAYTRNVMV